MKNKIILNIVLVYFVVVSIVLVMQLYLNSSRKNTPVTETVKLVDRLNNAVVLCSNSPVMLVNKRQTLIDDKCFNITPVVKNGCFYVPAKFFEAAYDAVVEDDFSKRRATLRMNNTAVVFTENAASAQVISNSNENEIQLENKVFYNGGMAYIPIDAFCDIFNEETFVYNDDMLVLSPTEENVAFDPAAEEELLLDIEQQVKNLPLVLSEERLKMLIGVKPAIFGFAGEKSDKPAISADNENMLLNKRQSDRFAIVGDTVYAIAGKKVSMIDSSAQSPQAVEMKLRNGFEPEHILAYEQYIYIIGRGENASMPVIEMTFEDGEETADKKTPAEKTIKGNKMFILCYDISTPAEPELKRWFCTDGSLVTKEIFDNSLCITVKKDAYELSDGSSYRAPSYCDLNKDTSVKFEEIKYFPEMRDTAYTMVYRFDLADIAKAADADVFLGAGDQYALGQNSVVFTGTANFPAGKEKMKKGTDVAKINLLSGAFTHCTADGSPIAVERINDGYALLAQTDKGNVLYTLNSGLKKDAETELSLKKLTYSSCSDNVLYLADSGKNNMLIVSLAQMYDETNDAEEPRIIMQPQEKGTVKLDGVEYIKPYETSAVGLGKNRELGNAEISMWTLKDTAVKTAGDTIGDKGTVITPVDTKNIVDNEMVFGLRLFVKQEEENKERYNGIYIYNISENNTPIYKGRISHNAENSFDKVITDAAYLNGKYFTLSENTIAINADDSELTQIYKAELE